MRFIKLTPDQQHQVERLYRESDNHRERVRAQALLVSHQGQRTGQLAELFSVDRDTVSGWLSKWEKQQAQQKQNGQKEGHTQRIHLRDAARSGRPCGLTAGKKTAAGWVREGLHRTRCVAERIQEQWQKTLSVWSLRRVFRQQGLSCKRLPQRPAPEE